MKVIHIVISVSRINFGVWNAAIFASEYLHKTYDVSSELWICTKNETDFPDLNIPHNYFDKNQTNENGFVSWISRFDKTETVIITHGAWLLPTRLGYFASKAGYKWIYTPHGMFEPDLASKGHLKKFIYFNIVEKRLVNKSDGIRAVSEVEKMTLETMFRRDISVIYNGVRQQPGVSEISKGRETINFLFLARLQRKKGLIFLVKAWADLMYDCQNARLIIAGPDEGELKLIQPYIKNNITYFGPAYGEDKVALLKEAHYYVLPSYSEGFPTSVVEAMSFGVIPVISEGCNFPQVFEEKLGYKVKPDEANIAEVLKQIISKPFDFNLSLKNIAFVEQHLSEKIIGNQLYSFYCRLFN